jgi:hypothetical protein
MDHKFSGCTGFCHENIYCKRRHNKTGNVNGMSAQVLGRGLDLMEGIRERWLFLPKFSGREEFER